MVVKLRNFVGLITMWIRKSLTLMSSLGTLSPFCVSLLRLDVKLSAWSFWILLLHVLLLSLGGLLSSEGTSGAVDLGES